MRLHHRMRSLGRHSNELIHVMNLANMQEIDKSLENQFLVGIVGANLNQAIDAITLLPQPSATQFPRNRIGATRLPHVSSGHEKRTYTVSA